MIGHVYARPRSGGEALRELSAAASELEFDGYFPTVDVVAEWTEDVEERMFDARRSRSQEA
jgi:hypothetical protein